MAADKLSAQQERFVAEYLKDLNGTQAAIRAGYSKRGAEVRASELLRIRKVAEAVAAGKARQLRKADLSAVRVLEELRRLSFADLRRLFDEKGNLRPIHELTEEEAASIAALEVVKRNLDPGDGKIDTVIKIKVYDKTKTLDTLAKHFNLLTEKVQLMADDELIAILHAGRRRAAEAAKARKGKGK